MEDPMNKIDLSLQLKGFEILIQETDDGIIVDVYNADENSSTGLLGSTYVYFDEQNAQDKLDHKKEAISPFAPPRIVYELR